MWWSRHDSCYAERPHSCLPQTRRRREAGQQVAWVKLKKEARLGRKKPRKKTPRKTVQIWKLNGVEAGGGGETPMQKKSAQGFSPILELIAVRFEFFDFGAQVLDVLPVFL